MIPGTLIGLLGSISNPFLSRSSRAAQTFPSSRASLRTGKWSTSPSSRSRLPCGTRRIYKCLDRIRYFPVLSTVYLPLRGIYGPNRQHSYQRSPLRLIADVSPPFIRPRSSCTVRIRGQLMYAQRLRANDIPASLLRT